AAVTTAATFLTDRNIFVFPERTDDRYALAMTDYIICKGIAFVVLLALFYGLFCLIFKKGPLAAELKGMLIYAAVYIPVAAAVLAVKLPEGFLTNDEYAISTNAVNLIHDTWFNYLTIYYYIVSYMLIPAAYGPIIMKVIIELAVIGYCLYRTTRCYGRRCGLIMYVLFLLYPVIAYTTSAHRLPVYFLIYLALFVKLLFDRLEKREIKTFGAIVLMTAGAVLTQWRTEGIYLFAFIPILMFIVYPNLRKKRTVAAVILGYVLIQYVISIPQNGTGPGGVSDAANDRMKPFYAYTITNMYRNGLDTKANEADLAIVDAYISTEAIEAINEYYEDINYEDVLILIKEEFGGVRADAGYTQYYDFTGAVKRIIINNPGVFLRTRWGAFRYAALPYHMTFSGTGLRELASFALSVVKSLSYNLFIPTAIIACGCIYCLVRRRWYTFFTAAGLAAHFAIVFILAPASYFKYYFPVYIMAYFYVVLLLVWLFADKNKNIGTPVI
ncbi:MAG: hypothetical protein IKQ40_04785, partial [Lachnospiraceae bacterium]|nr:hypothetical protein [Lachnospiraceae bacterium]